jgi:hypothetical protein
MKFIEALNEVVQNNKVVVRVGTLLHDYGHYSDPTYDWHMWTRIRMDSDDPTDEEALVMIETRNKKASGDWYGGWQDDNMMREDILAEDWEIVE